MADKSKDKEPKETKDKDEGASTSSQERTPTTEEAGPSKSSPTENTEDQDEEITLGAAVAGLSSWFSTTFTSAKEKSTEMLQYLKQDLSEFSESVSEVSKDFKDKLKLEGAAKSAVETVTSKASIVLDQMSTIFGVGPEDDDEAIVMPGPNQVVDRVKTKIYSLAADESIFLNDPEDIKAYESWLVTFDLENKNKEMVEMMAANPHLQLNYAQLVPEKVSHLVFWHRFYFRVHQICEAEEEARRRDLLRKSAMEGKESDDNRNDGHSPAGSDVVDISEEDQKRLLAEYEEEMKNSSAQHSRRSSGTQLSSSSSGSFAIVTHDAATDEVKVE